MNYIDIINDDTIFRSILSKKIKEYITNNYFKVVETKYFRNGNDKINSLNFNGTNSLNFVFVNFLDNNKIYISSLLDNVIIENIRKFVDSYIKYTYRKKIIDSL